MAEHGRPVPLPHAAHLPLLPFMLTMGEKSPIASIGRQHFPLLSAASFSRSIVCPLIRVMPASSGAKQQHTHAHCSTRCSLSKQGTCLKCLLHPGCPSCCKRGSQAGWPGGQHDSAHCWHLLLWAPLFTRSIMGCYICVLVVWDLVLQHDLSVRCVYGAEAAVHATGISCVARCKGCIPIKTI